MRDFSPLDRPFVSKLELLARSGRMSVSGGVIGGRLNNARPAALHAFFARDEYSPPISPLKTRPFNQSLRCLWRAPIHFIPFSNDP